MDPATAVLIGSVFALYLAEDVFFRRRGWNSSRKKKRRHRYWVREWIRRRANDERNTSFKLSKELLETNDRAEFKSMLRMNEQTYEELLEILRPNITKKNTTFRHSIPADERLCLTLDFLANGGSNYTLSRNYRLGRSTIGKILRSTCDEIYLALKDEYLKLPMDSDSWEKEARMFDVRWNFPHCIGALDGKHFRIYPPENSGSVYFNYKGSFSIVLLALANANYEFLCINVGCEGRVADGGIWRDSELKKCVDQGKLNLPLPEGIYDLPYVIVADDAFPLSPHIMKPFSTREFTEREEVYNYRLSRARRIMENTFGILCNRFRVFLNNIYRTPEMVESMILAAVCLHNFLRRKCGRNYIVLTDVDHEDHDHVIKKGAWRKDKKIPDINFINYGNPKRYAKEARKQFADFFISKEGELPWQYERMKDKDPADSDSDSD